MTHFVLKMVNPQNMNENDGVGEFTDKFSVDLDEAAILEKWDENKLLYTTPVLSILELFRIVGRDRIVIAK